MTEQHKEYIFEATKVYFGGYHVHSVNGELTRCKDCKWFGKSGCAILIVDESDMPKEDDFCSWAERKEE